MIMESEIQREIQRETQRETQEAPRSPTVDPFTRLKEAITAYVTGQGWTLNHIRTTNVMTDLVEMQVQPEEACAAIAHARRLTADTRPVYWLCDLPDAVRTYRHRQRTEETHETYQLNPTPRPDTHGVALDSRDHRGNAPEAQLSLDEQQRRALEALERKQAHRC
jgi:hypothetical protein